MDVIGPTAVGDGLTIISGLRGIAPNPAPQRTNISYGIARDGASVHIAIYAVNGRRTRVLVDGRAQAGVHRVTWGGRDDNGRKVASGIYFVVARIDGRQETRKVALIR